MENAYLDQNKREYEITKHVSLASLDPAALLSLKETGDCFVSLPEELFDLDYPGHYMRRIKSVSLTIPCVTGPYTSINATLTLLGNRIRTDTGVEGGYAYTDLNDGRFQQNVGAIQSIATSRSQNDSGLFELNFRDTRYLPFEGAGAISDWRLQLPDTFRHFDYETISDVIFHIQYTAKEGGDILKTKAIASLESKFATVGNELTRLFSLKDEFPSAWHRFLHPAGADSSQILELDWGTERFPYVFRDKLYQITKVTLFVQLTDKIESNSGAGMEFTLSAPNQSVVPSTLTVTPNPTEYGDLLIGEAVVAGDFGTWSLAVNTPDESNTSTIPAAVRDATDPNRLNAAVVENFLIICEYLGGL